MNVRVEGEDGDGDGGVQLEVGELFHRSSIMIG